MHAIGTREWAEQLARGVLAACNPTALVQSAMSQLDSHPPAGILAVGKSAADMALGARRALLHMGMCETPTCVMAPLERLGLLKDLPGIDLHIGDHPESTHRNQKEACEVLQWLRRNGPVGQIVVLLSGGASAYLISPMDGLRREDLDEIYAAIRQGGGTIEELNAVRKHCESMKGGRLAGLAKSTRVLVISDVLGDRLDVISSGPFVADPSTCQEAASVLTKFDLAERYPHILRHVSRIENESPKPGDAIFAHVEHQILASHVNAVRAASSVISQQGIAIRYQIDRVKGEPSEIAANLRDKIHSLQVGEGLIVGGEPTVDARHATTGARGGPSQEWCLTLAMGLREAQVLGTAWALSTDGVDGNSPYAGGWLSTEMLKSAHNRGYRVKEFRERHDASSFLEEAAGAIFTGPTGVNLNHVACVVRTG